MRDHFASAAVGVLLLLSMTAHAAVQFQLVPVDDVGNPTDPGNIHHFGSVSYSYSISAYEVTNSQYTEFLNAVDGGGMNALGLYNSAMGGDSASGLGGGIALQTNASAGHKYVTKAAMANKPVSYISYYDAARFANWLHNGQGAGSTESGVYNMTQSPVVRGPNPTYVIPTWNEWYKAAYYQPRNCGGDADGYWLFPTRSNEAPKSCAPPGDPALQGNVGNFYYDDGVANAYDNGYAVPGHPIATRLTDVGAYQYTPSYYGTFDQGGNVWEMTERTASGTDRYAAGGCAWGTRGYLQAVSFNNADRTWDLLDVGFRVAFIPEPTMGMVAGLTLAILSARLERR